ncbi:flagellar biosynthesis repressor FlbT [Paracoccus tegillarcae]|uniref:Flagellar biosynthesis repressor FlbT n=1 Tax=Paracoccus tegillarcae TaxID=1529068 RepID=A0A2K9EJ52_9RHOB|nr:flagellar biosynthesis repressor FlbT [Paracoccus tegillarcae]AUH33397.1 flagellar biosynthesis repressor FlbT [Paracoccus tegillarcae]
MSGLVIKLGPNERILINGAVIENGGRRSKISIKTPNANVLRLKDAIHPDQARTPVTRVCYVAQLILSGDAAEDEGGRQLLRGIEQLSQVFDDPDSRRLLAVASDHAVEGNIYQCLRKLRDLLPRETRLLSDKLQ